MSLNYIIYIALCILLQFLVEVKSQKTILNPDLRRSHTATFVNDKIYILGGEIPPSNSGKSPKETFMYLDVSAPFNTNELKWIDLSNDNIVPPHRSAAATRIGVNNNTILLLGGRSLADEIIPLIHTFDTQNNLWDAPVTTGIPPNNKLASVTIVIDSNGLIYIFGGSTIGPLTYYDDMFILDSINLNWKKASSIGAPSPRNQYGAVLLPNKNIIYMGK